MRESKRQREGKKKRDIENDKGRVREAEVVSIGHSKALFHFVEKDRIMPENDQWRLLHTGIQRDAQIDKLTDREKELSMGF